MSSKINNYREAKDNHEKMVRILETSKHQGCVGFCYDHYSTVKFKFIINEDGYERPQETTRLNRFMAMACADMEAAICQRALELS